jgi:hypothetical protein
MLQKNFYLALKKARNYEIHQKWMKLLFKVIYYPEILLKCIKISSTVLNFV